MYDSTVFRAIMVFNSEAPGSLLSSPIEPRIP